MKRLSMVALAVFVMGSLAFVAGCGDKAKEQELQNKVDTLQKENDTLNAKVKELETSLASCSATPAASPSPMMTATPEPTKAGGKTGGKATPTPKATATAAATATPAASPSPKVPPNLKLPGGKLPH